MSTLLKGEEAAGREAPKAFSLLFLLGFSGLKTAG